MNSLVLEIQRDALDKNVNVSDLLRKALVLAKKLKIKEFEEWIIKELNGYEKISDIPEYREVRGGSESLESLSRVHSDYV